MKVRKKIIMKIIIMIITMIMILTCKISSNKKLNIDLQNDEISRN